MATTKDVLQTIRQMTIRLESDATTAERLEALEQLQGMARTQSAAVGEVALGKAFEILQDGRSAEESQEALELINKLVTSRDRTAALSNTSLLLSQRDHVELLLYLLEHEDLTVGVQTSQILTELHANDGARLEALIQNCPEGMNKLLQRLPDTSREAVRNQALLLVQQLTSNNEEMKKTLVFNEGFEILFGIVQSEYNATQDTNMVVQDCLHVCCNILTASETCQRLFFGMGSEWSLRLAYFFDPVLLENPPLDESSIYGDAQLQPMLWYTKPGSVTCAALALAALANALTPAAPKHQELLGVSLAGLIPAASFSIARQGPLEMVDGALALLARLVERNAEVAVQVSAALLRLDPAVRGSNIPQAAQTPLLRFGWRPLPGDERTCIAIPALLAERYMYDSQLWAAEGQSAPPSPSSPRSVNGGSGGLASPARFYAMHTRGAFALGCLQVLEKIFEAHPEGCGLCIQHVLAPPLPPPEDEDDNPDAVRGAELEACLPLGSLLLGVLAGGLESAVQMGCSGVGAAAAAAAEAAEGARFHPRAAARGADVLSLVFAHGGSLARELSTAITTQHAGLGSGRPLLPALLSAATCAFRLPSHGPLLYAATLRMLACAATACAPAATQLLHDPASLEVLLDLAGPTADSSGVPVLAQCLTCFFLGSLAMALPEGPGDDAPGATTTRRSLLDLVDRRVTLAKFAALLSRPLESASSLRSELLFCHSFGDFYEAQSGAMLQAVKEFAPVASSSSSSAFSSSSTGLFDADPPDAQDSFPSPPTLAALSSDADPFSSSAPSSSSSPYTQPHSLASLSNPGSSPGDASPERLHVQTEALAVIGMAEQFQQRLEDERHELAHECEALRAKAAALEARLSEALGQFAVWQEAVQQRDERIVELGAVEEAFYTQQRDCTSLHAETEAQQRRSAELQAQVGDLSRRLEESVARESELGATRDSRSDEAAELAGLLDQARADAEAAAVQASSARQEAQSSDRLREQLEGDVIRLSEQTAALRAQLAQQERQQNGAIDGTAPPAPASDAALQQVAALEASLRDAQLLQSRIDQQLREAQGVAAGLESDVAEAAAREAELDGVVAGLEAASREAAAREAEMQARMQTAMQQAAQEMEQWARERADLKAGLGASAERERLLLADIAGLQQQLGDCLARLGAQEERESLLLRRVADMEAEAAARADERATPPPLPPASAPAPAAPAPAEWHRAPVAVATAAEGLFGRPPPTAQAFAPAPVPAVSLASALHAKSLFDTPPGQTSKRPDNDAANFFFASSSSSSSSSAGAGAGAGGGLFGAAPDADSFFAGAGPAREEQGGAPALSAAATSAAAEAAAAEAAATAAAEAAAAVRQAELDKAAAQEALSALQQRHALEQQQHSALQAASETQAAQAAAEAAAAAAREEALVRQLEALQVPPLCSLSSHPSLSFFFISPVSPLTSSPPSLTHRPDWTSKPCRRRPRSSSSSPLPTPRATPPSPTHSPRPAARSGP